MSSLALCSSLRHFTSWSLPKVAAVGNALLLLFGADRSALAQGKLADVLPEVRTTLSPPETRVGSSCALRSLIPETTTAIPYSSRVVIWRIGSVGESSGKVEHTPPQQLLNLDQEMPQAFRGLWPGRFRGLGDRSHPMWPLEPGWRGTEHKFTPRLPGVYLVRTEYETKDDQLMTGPPVILTVRPAAR